MQKSNFVQGVNMQQKISMNIPAIWAQLAQLGLTIAQHSDGYRYLWRGRLWTGPYKSEYQALQAAFDEAIQIMNSERPYREADGVWWLWENGWQYIGKLEQVKESETT
jgi:hypothetical protein